MKRGVTDIIDDAKPNLDFEGTYGPPSSAVRQLMDAYEASGDSQLGANAEDSLMLLGFSA